MANREQKNAGSADALIQKIEQAFAHRSLPSNVIEMEGRLQIDSDIDDALWFQGRERHSLTLEDWQKHNCGFSYFAPASFAYYLPSILTMAVENPRQYPDLAVDSFLFQLDRSPGMENLDPPIYERYLQFTDDEFEALKQWMLWACEHVPDVFFGKAKGGPGDGFGRAFDTLLLLQAEAKKCRDQ